MSEQFAQHLKENHFERYLNKLIKNLKNKKVVIYGAGSFFQYIQQNYDLSGLNIIGISDGKYFKEQEGQEDLGYKIIPKDKIIEYKPDAILVGTIYYVNLQEDLIFNLFGKTKIKVYPLAKIKFWNLLKKIWSEK